MLRVVEEALTFDDVLLVPAHSTVLPREVELKTRLTREISLNIPLVSAAMDTVTEARLAIALAQEGGIGIIHKNMSAHEQAEQVRRVKKYEAGVIKAPITVTPDTTIRRVLELTRKHNISGVPVVQGEDLVGIVTNRDLRFETRYDNAVAEVMTPKERLVTVKEGASRDEIKRLLHQHRIEKLLMVNDKFQLRGMVTVKDIQKSREKPNASKDDYERLRVGAAVGTGEGTDDRVAALVAAEVDIAHGHSQGVLNRVKWIKQHFPEVQIIGGNVATAEGALALVEAGVDAVKVGIGPGSICTTRIVSGVGVPQITAIANVTKALAERGVPVIADGGVRYSGDLAKAIVAGADCVMVGSMFAGTEESPGEVELYQGRSYKSYRGMGSLGAMQRGSSDRYFQEGEIEVEKLVPEGVEGRVPYKGSMVAIVHQLMGGLRASMGYTGCRNIDEMRTKPVFVRVTSAGMRESHVHDVTITRESPNYGVLNCFGRMRLDVRLMRRCFIWRIFRVIRPTWADHERHSSTQHPDPRLRFTINPTHRPPRARGRRVLRAASVRHERSRDPRFQSERRDPFRWSRDRDAGGDTARAAVRVRTQRAGTGHLLRHADHGAAIGRRGRDNNTTQKKQHTRTHAQPNTEAARYRGSHHAGRLWPARRVDESRRSRH